MKTQILISNNLKKYYDLKMRRLSCSSVKLDNLKRYRKK